MKYEAMKYDWTIIVGIGNEKLRVLVTTGAWKNLEDTSRIHIKYTGIWVKKCLKKGVLDRIDPFILA